MANPIAIPVWYPYYQWYYPVPPPLPPPPPPPPPPAVPTDDSPCCDPANTYVSLPRSYPPEKDPLVTCPNEDWKRSPGTIQERGVYTTDADTTLTMAKSYLPTYSSPERRDYHSSSTRRRPPTSRSTITAHIELEDKGDYSIKMSRGPSPTYHNPEEFYKGVSRGRRSSLSLRWMDKSRKAYSHEQWDHGISIEFSRPGHSRNGADETMSIKRDDFRTMTPRESAQQQIASHARPYRYLSSLPGDRTGHTQQHFERSIVCPGGIESPPWIPSDSLDDSRRDIMREDAPIHTSHTSEFREDGQSDRKKAHVRFMDEIPPRRNYQSGQARSITSPVYEKHIFYDEARHVPFSATVRDEWDNVRGINVDRRPIPPSNPRSLARHRADTLPNPITPDTRQKVTWQDI